MFNFVTINDFSVLLTLSINFVGDNENAILAFLITCELEILLLLLLSSFSS